MSNEHWNILQIGSFKGNTVNDAVFGNINSNTRAIFVEPVPSYYEDLKKNYNEKYPNNRFVFLNNAVAPIRTSLPIYVPSKTNTFEKLPWWIEQCSGSNPDHFKNHGHDIAIDKVEARAITLHDIINAFKIKSLDYLEIDTEGMDYDILMSLDLSILKPKYIVFEHLHMDGYATIGPKYKALLKYLKENGYVVEHMARDNTTMKLTT